MYVLYDSVTPDEIPVDAQAVAGYIGGMWPNYAADVKQWPHAYHLPIAVNADEDGDCLDVETGDATPEQAPAWFRRAIARGVAKPAIYANLSTWPAVFAVMRAEGIPVSAFRKWVADWTNEPHIPFGFDACQWTKAALGLNLDESLCVEAFFRLAPADPYTGLSVLERALAVRYAELEVHPELHPWACAKVFAELIAARKAVWVAADRGELPDGQHTQAGWEIDERKQRYATLSHLTGWPPKLKGA